MNKKSKDNEFIWDCEEDGFFKYFLFKNILK